MLLKEQGVDFVVIGATCFPIYGYVRATLNVDIFIRPERSNAERTRLALESFGYDMTDVSINDLLTKKVLIRQYIVLTDIHPFVKGISFDEVWKSRKEEFFGKTLVPFASLNDLIKMKEAAGRPQDLEDLKYLYRLKKMKNFARKGE